MSHMKLVPETAVDLNALVRVENLMNLRNLVSTLVMVDAQVNAPEIAIALVNVLVMVRGLVNVLVMVNVQREVNALVMVTN